MYNSAYIVHLLISHQLLVVYNYLTTMQDVFSLNNQCIFDPVCSDLYSRQGKARDPSGSSRDRCLLVVASWEVQLQVG